MFSSSISFLSGGLGDFGGVIGAIMVVKALARLYVQQLAFI